MTEAGDTSGTAPLKGTNTTTTLANISVEARSNRSKLSLDSKRTPIHVRWQNLHYSVAINDPASSKCCGSDKIDKVILDNISGEAQPGKLVAIMGPSGSGKTTLLNCLAKRITEEAGSVLEGRITLNGVDRQDVGSKFARIAAYVQQDDVLFNMQTVEETLLTAAKLRLSKDLTLEDKQSRVNAIIQELGLVKARNTRIGDAKNRGVSGGERKRTNIGVEMIQDPSLLFLDEPTSGLDAFQALNVVQTLKVLCHNQCTVIMSIHQPRSSIFQLFDQLILLADGKLVYSGEAGKSAVDYFDSLGFVCPDLFNPADHFLDIVSVDNRSPEEEEKSQKRIDMLVRNFQKQSLDRQAVSIGETGGSSSLAKFVPQQSVHSSYKDQLLVLGTRALRQVVRDKFTLGINIFMTLFFALFLSGLYSETDDGQKGIQDKQGILFFITINQSFGPLLGALNTFTVEKAIVMRERQAKSYHLSSYYVTKLAVSLPVDVILPCLFGSVVYWIVGLKDDFAAFIIFLVITFLTSLVAISMGFVFGAIAPNIDAANAMAPLFMVLAILFGGFYINSDNIPVWLSWLEYWSHIRWSYMAFAINEFEDAKFKGCDHTDGESACFENGEEVLKLLSMNSWDLWQPILALVSLLCIYHCIAYLTLRFKKAHYMEVNQTSLTRVMVSNDSEPEANLEVNTNAKRKGNQYKAGAKPTMSKKNLLQSKSVDIEQEVSPVDEENQPSAVDKLLTGP